MVSFCPVFPGPGRLVAARGLLRHGGPAHPLRSSPQGAASRRARLTPTPLRSPTPIRALLSSLDRKDRLRPPRGAPAIHVVKAERPRDGTKPKNKTQCLQLYANAASITGTAAENSAAAAAIHKEGGTTPSPRRRMTTRKKGGSKIAVERKLGIKLISIRIRLFPTGLDHPGDEVPGAPHRRSRQPCECHRGPDPFPLRGRKSHMVIDSPGCILRVFLRTAA